MPKRENIELISRFENAIATLKIDLTDEQFCLLCQNNRDRKFESTALER